jgi:nitrogen regulatory protein P-II 1
MKRIEAIVRESKFEEVKEALRAIDIDFFTYWDCIGVGNQKKHGMYRGTVYDTEYIPRRVLSIIVRDVNLRKTVDCVLNSAFTGEIGDGKIFVSNIEESWRIRTKESGDDSLYNRD